MLVMFWTFTLIGKIQSLRKANATWVTFWTLVYGFLTNTPSDVEPLYSAKFWIVRHITEPILEAAYVRGIRSYKPISQYLPSDLI